MLKKLKFPLTCVRAVDLNYLTIGTAKYTRTFLKQFIFSDYPVVVGGWMKGGHDIRFNALMELDELAGWTVGFNDEQIKTLYDSYFAST